MRGQIGYADALKILGVGQSKTLRAINRLLGGAILAATAATGQIGLLALLAGRDELASRSAELLSNLGQRVRGASGKSRTDLLVAAHAVIVVNAYFEALRGADLPFDLARLELTAEEQAMLAGARQSGAALKLVHQMIEAAPPLPTAHRPYEDTLFAISFWYRHVGARLEEFISGLAVWDGLDDTRRERLHDLLMDPTEVPDRAVNIYEENYRRLALDCPEFSLWMHLADSAASRAAIKSVGEAMDTGLAGLQSVLESLTGQTAAAEWPARLALAYRAQLSRPIAETAPSEALAGLVVPPLASGYVNPQFLVAEYSSEARPAEEDWWHHALLIDDVELFLAGHLTSPAAVEVPLVLLGQPGSGKSLLTKVLAARLPPEDYLPVRVELRHVDADAPLQDQIEAALRQVTGERMEWPDLVRGAGGALPVVMLDGFDELLQSTGVSHSGFLEQVREFQRREADQLRPLAFIVTSRTVVADRVRFPPGTVVAKMEPFDDTEIERWLVIWNEANAAYFSAAQPELRPLPIEAVLPHRGLAEQPLLLLMLSFYDADGNALQQHSDQMARADLYEGLLAKFVDRELDKLHADAEKPERDDLAALEFDELSVVAFAMFNRGRKSVSEDDLDGDLAVLLPPEDDIVDDAAARMARRLSRAQMAVGRFFFIHKSQAIVGDARLNDYEFLHATFGEYLVARLVSKILDDLVKLNQADRPSRAVRSGSGLQDDRLWELLSFAPMADGSQILGFLGELIRRPGVDRMASLRAVLVALYRRSLHPRQRYDGYEPRHQTVPSRHAAYSANLLLLNVVASDGALHASALFGTQDGIVDSWRSFALLWRSQLEPAGWDGLINAVSVSRGPSPAGELFISYSTVRLTKPIEHYATVDWLRTRTDRSGQDIEIEETGINAEKTAWQAIFLCAPELDLLINALQPLLRLSPQAFRQITYRPDGSARSVMHEVLQAIIDTTGLTSDRDSSIRVARNLLRSGSPLTVQSNVWGRTSRFLSTTAVQAAHSLSFGSSVAVPFIGNFWPAYTALHDQNEPAESEETFPALRLLTADYDAAVKTFKIFPDLADIDAIFARVNPMELAAEEPSFIDSVLQLVREQDLQEWAGVQGVALLAVMAAEKLASLTELNVEFVFYAASRIPAQATVVRLIRDRYKQDHLDLAADGHSDQATPEGAAEDNAG